MNKTAIKNYAIWARVQLIESAKQRAYEYEITEDGENNPNLDAIGGRLLSKVEKEQRQQLIAEIRQKGYSQVMEEAAYTWFNRFIALRFMEVNGYLPSKVRVFTDENNAFKPEILKEAMSIELDGLDRSLVLELLDRQDNEALYKYLLITQCNTLNAPLPYMFEKIDNWTELLFPANLLRQDSVIGRLISDIDEADWNDEVEIIGWFYQYYISEKHDAVVDPLHGKVVAKEDIPAATQLFTTDWVVRYILDNSLGRYWVERHPESKLTGKLTYFVTPKDGKMPLVNESISPEELKVLDPCVGSGHFLSYAFDILLEIYREYGWSDRDAAKSIIEKNLYGLDIDDRAAQLACFAVMMKARKYNRRIFSADTKLHVLAMQDSTFMTEELIKFVAGRDESIRDDLNELRVVFNNAKEYGSIICVPHINYSPLYSRIQEIENASVENLFDDQYRRSAVEELLPLIRQAEILACKYDVVATNPPYMNKYSARLKAYINEHFEEYKGDLFSVFIYRNFGFCKENGYSGFMTPMVWMFIKTYESLRTYIVQKKSFTTLIQFEYSAFEEATVPICSFVLKNGREIIRGQYFKLSNFRGGMEVQRKKTEEAIRDRNCGYYFEAEESNFSQIPGTPVAFWASENAIRAFSFQKIGDISVVRQGLSTGDNDRFLRLWFEVCSNLLVLDARSKEEVWQNKKKWVPINKGGPYRRWYGNNEYVIAFDAENYDILSNTSNHLPSRQLYFRDGITWSNISSGQAAFRWFENGFTFSNKGACIFVDDLKLKKNIIAFLNSKLVTHLLAMTSPTIGFEPGYIATLSLKEHEYSEKVAILSEVNIGMCKIDWDSFEISWDFKRHPLLPNSTKTTDIQLRASNPDEAEDATSPDEKQMEFAVFCVENLARDLGKDPIDVYDLLTRDSDILQGYILPCYDALHSQGKEYVCDDIKRVMREKGVLP